MMIDRSRSGNKGAILVRGRAGGFTLIEMLAVVGIIAILAALAIPRLTGALEKARYAKAIGEVSNIFQAAETYRILNGTLPLQMADMVPLHLSQEPVDPWGLPYVYNNFTQIPPGWRRKDGPLVPINTEYDVYSSGPNKQSTPNIRSQQGRDDVILANAGGFIGIANDY